LVSAIIDAYERFDAINEPPARRPYRRRGDREAEL
jgi:hypothetical protein